MIRSTSAALLVAACVLGQSSDALGQDAPQRGPRHVDPRWHALKGATLIPAPGERVENATIVTRDGVIVSVSEGGEVPNGARVWDYTGLVIHAGFVDPYVTVDANKPDPDAEGGHWQTDMVTPGRSALDGERLSQEDAKELRSLGFTVAGLAPGDGIFRGSGAVVALGSAEDDTSSKTPEVIARDVFHTLAFSTAGWGSDGVLRYPTSEMGAIALARQTFFDVEHHAACLQIDEANPEGHDPVQPELALEALMEDDRPLLFVARNELQLLRAARLADEFERRMMAVGTGTEFRRLAAIVETGIPLVVPLAFPSAPDVSTREKAEQHSLRALSGWEQAPTNVRRLVDEDVTVALTTARLEKRSDFTKNLRKAIEAGLGEDAALAALTVTPAELLGVDDRVGRVEPGMLAHLVVREGEPFAEDGKVRDVWVAGKRHKVNNAPARKVAGEYDVTFDRLGDEENVSGTMTIEGRKSLSFEVSGETIEARKTRFGPLHVHFHLRGEDFGSEGVYSGTGMFEGEKLFGAITGPDGVTERFDAERVGDVTEEDEEGSEEDAEEASEKSSNEGDDEGGDEPESDADDESDATDDVPEELALPFGAYGRAEYPEERTVVFKGATVWTSADAGVVEGATVVIQDGGIRYVGPPELAPTIDGAEVVDVTGKHITPGIIDCHSHTGISGGVNEVGRRVTAEVRIADVIDPDDMSFYRQLAGGVTAANQLHGSANAIGGQNSVVKLRWGAEHPDDMRLDGAMPGIKFALGENPKRVAAGADDPDEYPQSRMGVAALIEDRLAAGRDYRESWGRFENRSGWKRRGEMPPRVDLELEALGEIVAGERWIHSHSYRQDEILMLARLAQQFGFKIGTFQHVLEGYKVADAIADAAVGASTFSDWWAYKFEVVDAIPHNAALMTDVGVNVSINSDSDEHARRLNTEAGKAVKYGGLEPAEALKLVTLNPAIQLGVDDRVGSLEVGKDADLAIWTGDPLSYTSRCVSTWIDGAEMWNDAEDREMREAAEAERQRIIQKLLEQSVKKGQGRGERGGDRPQPTARPVLADSRDLARMRDEMEALWRSGSDPSWARPGVCGCFDVLFEEAAARARK